MNVSSPRSAVTTTVTNLLAFQGPTTRLALPYHYRRNGIYYLRLRATGSTTESASVSLKTSNRRAALDASDQLSGLIRAFHRQNPKALWSELKQHFLLVSAEVLGPKRLGSRRMLGERCMQMVRVVLQTLRLSLPARFNWWAASPRLS